MNFHEFATKFKIINNKLHRQPDNVQYRSKLWDHLPRFCLGRIAVLICSFTSAKPRLTALKTSVSPRFFPVDLSRSERQDAGGFE